MRGGCSSKRRKSQIRKKLVCSSNWMIFSTALAFALWMVGLFSDAETLLMQRIFQLVCLFRLVSLQTFLYFSFRWPSRCPAASRCSLTSGMCTVLQVSTTLPLFYVSFYSQMWSPVQTGSWRCFFQLPFKSRQVDLKAEQSQTSTQPLFEGVISSVTAS